MQMDFKKTILWAVFSMSGLMLYSNWQVHEGKPSLFGGTPVSAPVQTEKSTTNTKQIFQLKYQVRQRLPRPPLLLWAQLKAPKNSP